MNIQEELSLVARAQSGDQPALSALWDDITPKLYGYLRNVVRDTPLAEDLLQNTWQKAIESLTQFEPRGVRFSAWLFAIAKNECRQEWRSARPHMPLDEAVEYETRTTDATSLETAMLIEQIMKSLSEEDREMIRLRFLAELSFKEIATVCHISAVTARVRVHRAIIRARTILQTTHL
jgi:RNA polymerase sigma-70 factor (ECF subfamily)